MHTTAACTAPEDGKEVKLGQESEGAREAPQRGSRTGQVRDRCRKPGKLADHAEGHQEATDGEGAGGR